MPGAECVRRGVRGPRACTPYMPPYQLIDLGNWGDGRVGPPVAEMVHFVRSCSRGVQKWEVVVCVSSQKKSSGRRERRGGGQESRSSGPHEVEELRGRLTALLTGPCQAGGGVLGPKGPGRGDVRGHCMGSGYGGTVRGMGLGARSAWRWDTGLQIKRTSGALW
jgi:hypothetical protein